jgi:F-type H+-transporting ATPase subunit delta
MKVSKQTKRAAKQLFRHCLTDGVLNEDRARQVVQHVVNLKRGGRLALLSHFRRLVKEDNARHTARVESAAPMPQELQASIAADLGRVYGPGLKISYAENPALIGGMRIQAGSDVYDGSVWARLTALEQTL